ncbi:hypothetical protein [Micromonospora avicenniae]|uniref:hypothetical protein n=1 Tax=Micromonospora avicenniae TaxID=1198245 RepID=UPI0034211B17
MSAAIAAPLGWAGGWLTGAGPLVVGLATGVVVGLLGVRPHKVLLGPLLRSTATRLMSAG